MSLRVTTWNVNSIGARLPTVLRVLESLDADVVCLQELKCEEAKFPSLELQALGYNVILSGQKTYNGVALLSKWRLEDVRARLPGDDADQQARYVEALVNHDAGPVRIASLYAPNGNPVESEKFPYKLAWLQRLEAHARELLALEEPLILAGDYNIIPRPQDCFDPAAWAGDALFRPESLAAYQRLLHLGLQDAFLAADARPHQYTFWDYQAGAWQRDRGIRIDHLLCSPEAADRLQAVSIMREARGFDKPSDHVPISAIFGA